MHSSATRFAAFASLCLVASGVGCGRISASDAEQPAEAGTIADAQAPKADAASPADDAGGKTQLEDDAGTVVSKDAGLCEPVDAASLVGRVPVSHRSAGTTCPARASGGIDPSSCGFDAGAVACAQDGDCSGGKNGRCLWVEIPPPPICAPPYCSYDQCEADSDCASGPCDCRISASDNAPNVCATGSNCRTDSDCGQGGYCSPGGFLDGTCSQPVFFCHGPADECIDDSDCCATSACTYDATLGHFACGHGCIPPP